MNPLDKIYILLLSKDADLLPIEEPKAAQQPAFILESPSPASENQERALVLFKPVSHSPIFSPSSFPFTVDSDVVSAINNQRPWSRQSVEDEAICRDLNNRDRLALVQGREEKGKKKLRSQKLEGRRTKESSFF
ncbi:hypothetical protein K1719_047350 [Acacia pycnantha]|nr:hypothetical protein K1719_047350 [Acacia pycnantha]